MEIKKLGRLIETYKVTEDFFVDVQESGDSLDFYLYHKNYSVKSLMFGVPCKDLENGELTIESMIENNLQEQIELYREEYMDCV